MKFGVTMFPTDYSIGPAELAKAVEERGFESLFFPEHTHIPTSRRTPWPGGGELPREYSHTLDPFVALSAAATATDHLLIGTGVCLVIERDPITLAKEVASLDFISRGRLMFGIGAGWNLEEMENHGTNPPQRWKLMREQILAMKTIWTQDEAEFHGRFVNFDPIWSWPKPVQKPHPPILIGGDGPHAFRRVVEYGDGWIPIPVVLQRPLSDCIAELNRLAAEAGREPIPVTVYGAASRPEVIQHYAELGVECCLLWLPSAPADKVLPLLDSYAEVAKSFA
jgi:probable F420-dependent oxidoreductase